MLDEFIRALEAVNGLTALVLGGSRARGTATATSDYDLGLYYETDAPLDVAHLQSVIAPFVDEPDRMLVTSLGEWGPWINGGGWLSVGGQRVDLLYRDLGRVEAVIARCREGQISMEYQPGHPHGFCSAIWMGEVALCRPLFDPHQRVAQLKERTSPFPPCLQSALLARFHWEVGFSLSMAQGAINRGEQSHLAGCVYRALCCVAQVLYAVNERYLINEKGALAEASTFPLSIERLAENVDEIWALLGAKKFPALMEQLHQVELALDILVAQSQQKTG